MIEVVTDDQHQEPMQERNIANAAYDLARDRFAALSIKHRYATMILFFAGTEARRHLGLVTIPAHTHP
jgi:hypothetical protein